MKKQVINIFLGIMILIFLGFFVHLIKNSQKKRKKEELMSPFYTTIENKRLIGGTLRPSKEIEIKSQVSGILEELFVEIGMEVKSGQKIAKIKLVPNPANLELAKTNLETARIRYSNTQKNYKRQKFLFNNDIIPSVELQEYETIYLIAKEEYISAKNQLNILKDGIAKGFEDVSTVVLSTSDGMVMDLPLKSGSSIIERNNFTEGSTIAVIANMNSFVFKGRVLENDLVYLNEGKEFEIRLNAYKEKKYLCQLIRISPQGTEEMGVMKFEIEANVAMTEDTFHFRSGYTATAEIILEKHENVLTVAEKSLAFRNDSAFLEVLMNNSFKERYIITGLTDGINVEVIGGIKKSEKYRKVQ